jgi:hypothetical protein
VHEIAEKPDINVPPENPLAVGSGLANRHSSATQHHYLAGFSTAALQARVIRM